MAGSLSKRLCSLASSLSVAIIIILCQLLLQNPPVASGHLLRHGHGRHHHDNHHHYHHDDAEYENDQHSHNHHHHKHRRANSLQSDGGFDPYTSTEHHADIFDSCFVACYADIVDRYGIEFANQLREDGFTYEDCPDDDDNSATDSTAGGVSSLQGSHQYTNSSSYTNSTEISNQQRALHRILGATNQLHRLWTKPSYRGSDGKLHIPYLIRDTSHFTTETLSTISMAMAHIENTTGVLKFIPRTYDQTEYIYFTYEEYYAQVCAANLGKQTDRPTNVYLGWCRSARHLGNVVHELLHALGFWHEHSRPDRDDHVQIIWSNLRTSALNNFAKATNVDSRGSPYDFNSIMHYPSVSFSTNREPTIVPIEPLEKWETMGQRVRLSPRDVDELRLLYQCASGPREGGDIPISELCTVDCPCWEYAMGECSSDDECMGDLICGETPNPLPSTTHEDVLPYYDGTSGSFSCNEYCHVNCCYYANSVIQCPETCDSAPPTSSEMEEVDELPTRMCIKSGAPGTRSAGGSSVTTEATVVSTSASTTQTATTTTSSTTTTSTTTTPDLGPPWYVDWSIDKCVQFCFGPAPCGGFDHEAELHSTVEECCEAHLDYIPFDSCHTIPEPTLAPTDDALNTLNPSDFPTTSPSREPTAQPSKSPSQNPTSSPVVATTTTTTSTTTTTTTTAEGEVFESSGEWYIDYDIQKCVRDCIGEKPCSYRRKDSWEPGHSSVQRCCNGMNYIPFVECSNEPSIETRAGGASVGKNTDWYPGSTKCNNDGNAPTWIHPNNKYTSQSRCCKMHFEWDYNNCMDITPAETNKWYISWAKGKCVKDCQQGNGRSCGGLVPGSWIKMHDSAESCCMEHMSYEPFAECRFDDS